MTPVYILFSGYYREVESIHTTFDNARKALIAVLNTPGELEKELAPYVSTAVRLHYEPDKEHPDNPAVGTWTPVDENEDAYSDYSIEGYEVIE